MMLDRICMSLVNLRDDDDFQKEAQITMNAPQTSKAAK